MTRRRLLALLLATAAAGCTGPDRVAERRKPGGGAEDDTEGGIGGTGIYGIVTALGSLMLGDLSVATPPGVPVRDALGPIALGAIVPGDVVAIDAGPVAGTLTARRIERVDALIGPLVRRGAEVSVLGVPLDLPPGAAVVADGTRVRVSGLWNRGRVVVSRLAPVQTRDDLVSGLLDRAAGGGGRINAVPVTVEPPYRPRFAIARGRWDGTRLQVSALDLRGQSPFGSPFETPLARLRVEAYLVPNDGREGHHLSGVGLPLDPAGPLPPLVGRRGVFEGTDARAFRIDRAAPR